MGKKTKKPKTSETPVTPPKAESKRTTSSSFYPAVEMPPEAPKPSEELLPPVQPVKSSKRGKQVASWAIQVAVVAIPAAISGISSYMSAKSDTEAGYKTMVTAVSELQDATKELVKQQAYMQGELDALRGEASRLHGKRLKTEPPPKLEKVTLSNIPEDLGAALKGRGMPMTQQVLTLAPPKLEPEEKAILSDAEKKRAIAVEELKKRKAEEKAVKKDDDTAQAAPPE